jgi:exodeoxyribonuclease V alpha subunit
VAGLGPKRTAMIGRAWEEQKAIKEVMVFLQGVGVSTSLAVRIYKTYGDGAISVVRDEPYRLAAEVWGIGFKTADTIAQAVGIPHDSPQRVQAGIQYTLSEAADHGHCYLPEPNLVTDAAQILGVDAVLVRSCLAELAELAAGRGGDPRTRPQPDVGGRDDPAGVPRAAAWPAPPGERGRGHEFCARRRGRGSADRVTGGARRASARAPTSSPKSRRAMS